MRYFLSGNMHSCIQRLILSIFIFLAFNIVLSKSNETGIFYSTVFAQSCSPSLLGSYDTSYQAWGVYVSGTTAYVTDQASGLQIIDVSNPVSPSLLGSYDTPGSARGVFVSGTTAYVTDLRGLQIIDVSNSDSPSLLGSFDAQGSGFGPAESVFVSGTTAYVASGSFIRIDVSKPALPSRLGLFFGISLSIDVFVSGTTAYVCANGKNSEFQETDLQIIDVSNPDSPSLLGSYETPDEATDVYVSGTTAYVADHSSGLQIIDVSNPVSPSLLGSYDTPGSAQGVFVSGTTAYVADRSEGLQIIDVSNPASPSLLGNYNTPSSAYGVYVSGTTAYVTDLISGLQIIDVSCTTKCTYSASARSLTYFTSIGGTGSVDVKVSDGCSWTASSDVPWIVMNKGSSGSGEGILNFSILPNTSVSERTGTVTFAGEKITFTQEGVKAFPNPQVSGFVSPSHNTVITVALDPGTHTGENADWWVAAETPSGDWYYFYAGTMSWVFAGSSYTDLSPTYQGPLFYLKPLEVLNVPRDVLPKGTYWFYFAVETNMNGLLDLGQLYFSRIFLDR